MTRNGSLIFALAVTMIFVLPACLDRANAQAGAASPRPSQPPAIPQGGTPSTDCPTAQQAPSLPQNLPEGYVLPTEEEGRYSDFFMQLYAWDSGAKQADAAGDSGWADHFRTTLERESGLKPDEAAQVKKIVFQYLRDEQEWQERFSNQGMRERAAHPDTVPRADTPEITALRREHAHLLDKAIADLLTALGSRSFSKLDLFTRHMNDRMKANPAQSQAGCSNSGVR